MGVRYTTERLEDSTAQDTNLGPVPTDRFFSTPVVFSSDNVSPTANLLYKVTPGINTYFTFGTGFYRGGTNNPAFCALLNRDPCDVKPEKVYNYEVGLKGQFFQRKLGINLAVFYEDYRNLQRGQQFSVDFQQVTITGNINKTEIYGVELESTLHPFARLSLFGNVGYQHSQIKDYPGAILPDGFGNVFIANLKNVPLSNAPEWTLNGGGEYDLPLGHALLGFVGGEAQYRSSQSFNLAGRRDPNSSDPTAGVYVSNNPFFVAAPQTNINLRAGVRNAARWTLTARVDNLLDRSYINGVDGAGGGFIQTRFVTLSPPRTFSAEFRVNF